MLLTLIQWLISLFSVRIVFSQVNEEFLQIVSNVSLGRNGQVGSTCLLSMVLNDRLTVANIGDSIALLVNKDGSVHQMNTEHKPTANAERRRIEEAGGIVLAHRVQGELSVSRAFGDFELRNYISAEPDVRSLELNQNHDLLILASDGIFQSYPGDKIVTRIN